jgi:hypothetical protein
MPQTLEQLSFQEEIILDIFRQMGEVRDAGVLHDMVYVCQRLGVIEQSMFEFSQRHVRSSESMSPQVYDALHSLEAMGKIHYLGSDHPLMIDEQTKAKPAQRLKRPEQVKIVGALPSNNVGTLARILQMSDRLGIDLGKQLTGHDHERLFGALLYPRSMVEEYQSVYRQLVADLSQS